MTALGDQLAVAGCSPRRPSTVSATPARLPSTSARSWASQRSSISSRVSPSWLLALRVANVACRASRTSSSEFGARPNRASNAAASSALLGVICRRRELNRSITASGTPTISRDFPSGRVTASTPSERVSRAVITRSPTADAAGRQRRMLRPSSVRHTPSGPSTRLRTALWMCRCGSCSRESCWKNDATIQSCAST